MTTRSRSALRRLSLVAVLLASPARIAAAQGPSQPTGDAVSASSAPDAGIRASAAADLARSGEAWALLVLRRILTTDPVPEVRIAAATAMAATGYPQYIYLLAGAAEDEADPRVRAAIVFAHERLSLAQKSPRWAAGLSLLCPGCGHLYLGQRSAGLGFLASTVVLLGSGLGLAASSGIADDPAGEPHFKNARGPVGLELLFAAQNLWMYSIFAAYRDARIAREDRGYRYPSSDESLATLVSAPFRPSVLRRPWFWAGLPLMFGGALALTWFADRPLFDRDHRSLSDGKGVRFMGGRFGTLPGASLAEAYFAALFLPVGVGEEALFRGVLQPSLSESLGPWGGWVAASLIFGAVHIGNFLGPERESTGSELRKAALAIPFITMVGSYLGFVSLKTHRQLATSVALHFWYDFLLGTASFVADPDNQPFVVRLALPI